MKKPMTYKGYCAKIEYSDEHGCLIGRVSDIRRSITFQGDSVEKIRQAFEEAFDFYLTDCADSRYPNERGHQVIAEAMMTRLSKIFDHPSLSSC
jgi:predicted HicB family RNase H-like nuclease